MIRKALAWLFVLILIGSFIGYLSFSSQTFRLQQPHVPESSLAQQPPMSSPVSEAPLADQIYASLNEVADWSDLVNIGVVMHKSSMMDFDTWITKEADASD